MIGRCSVYRGELSISPCGREKQDSQAFPCNLETYLQPSPTSSESSSLIGQHRKPVTCALNGLRQLNNLIHNANLKGLSCDDHPCSYALLGSGGLPSMAPVLVDCSYPCITWTDIYLSGRHSRVCAHDCFWMLKIST